jgi:predicted acylesterase/phospholipase RssA
MDADELFLAGGGFRIVPFLGVLADLDLAGRPLVYTGLSAGALLAFLLALQYTVADVVAMMLEEDWPSLLRDACDFHRALRGEPLLDARPVELLVTKALRGRGLPADLSMAALDAATAPSRLRVLAARVAPPGLIVLAGGATPSLAVVTALCASTAIPLVFPSVVTPVGTLFDAGIIQNCPLDLRVGPKTLALLQSNQAPGLRSSPFGSAWDPWEPGPRKALPWRSQLQGCACLVGAVLSEGSLAARDPSTCDLCFVPQLSGVQTLRVDVGAALRGIAVGLLAWRLRPHLDLLLLATALCAARLLIWPATPPLPPSCGTPRSGGPPTGSGATSSTLRAAPPATP